MTFIFAKLPLDVILYEILTYDKHFKIEKGKLISIIPKDDDRYELLKTVTFVKDHFYTIGNFTKRYEYRFLKNLHDFEERKTREVGDDIVELTMYTDTNKQIECHVAIYRLKPMNEIQMPNQISSHLIRRNIIEIPNMNEYVWLYRYFRYFRF